MHFKSIVLLIIISFFLSCNSTKTGDSVKQISALEALSSSSNKNKVEKRFPLLVSNDAGETWEPVSANLPRDLQVSFISESGNELVVASDNKGVFMSSENKSTWKSIGDPLPNPKINAIHVAGETIYVGVYRQGIYQTEDEGKTWKSLNHDLQNLSVQAIIKVDQQLLIGNDEGIFSLVDDTKSWKKANVQSQVLSLYQYNDKLVAGTSQGTLLSKDKGNRWEWIRKEGAVHYTHNIGQRVIELVLDGDVVYSDDWGKSWTQTEYKPRSGSYVYKLIENGTYQLLSNNYGIHRSTDKGKTWKHIFKTESMAFFDLVVIDNQVYGGTRAWDEYRKRKR